MTGCRCCCWPCCFCWCCDDFATRCCRIVQHPGPMAGVVGLAQRLAVPSRRENPRLLLLRQITMLAVHRHRGSTDHPAYQNPTPTPPAAHCPQRLTAGFGQWTTQPTSGAGGRLQNPRVRTTLGRPA
jgi:hypothetical protein